jgi:L-aminopeptidase/D-esterase-like protein
MKAGLGTASITMPDGLVVGALVAVNAVGDIIDPATGKVIAGVRTLDGKGLADSRKILRAGRPLGATPGQNTTIGVVATNARLTKVEATKVPRWRTTVWRAPFIRRIRWATATQFSR